MDDSYDGHTERRVIERTDRERYYTLLTRGYVTEETVEVRGIPCRVMVRDRAMRRAEAQRGRAL